MRGLVAMILAGLLPVQAGAANAERGRVLADRWCVECHVVPDAEASADAGPPLASLPVETAQGASAVRAWLFDPHPPMPGIDLRAGQIEDIIAYIRRLRASTRETSE